MWVWTYVVLTEGHSWATLFALHWILWVSWFKSSFVFSKCDSIVLSKGFCQNKLQGCFPRESGTRGKVTFCQRSEPCVDVLGVFPTLPLELSLLVNFSGMWLISSCCPFYLCQHFYLTWKQKCEPAWLSLLLFFQKRHASPVERVKGHNCFCWQLILSFSHNTFVGHSPQVYSFLHITFHTYFT